MKNVLNLKPPKIETLFSKEHVALIEAQNAWIASEWDLLISSPYFDVFSEDSFNTPIGPKEDFSPILPDTE